MRAVYRAVADPARRRLLRLIADADELSLHAMTAQFQIGRSAVSKHLAILKEDGLVIDRKIGRGTRYQLNAAPLREIQEWVAFYKQCWTARIDRLKDRLEQEDEEARPLYSRLS